MACDDTMQMARALALAARGRGRTSPNPMVGAVIVDAEGIVVGRGSHERAGGPHAEILALADAGEHARGATLYCTLEPCSHTGRTGPCAPRVADAGIRRVVVAVRDPNPLVAGRGLQLLQARGLEVSVGVLQHEAERLNGPFFTVMRRRRPFVTMKAAISRDACVAAEAGTRTALTGPAANRFIHRERAEVDAIAIGSGTLLVDDPVLTARGAYRVRPLTRVVFDRTLRTPATARILSTLGAGPIIVVTEGPSAVRSRQKVQELEGAGARVLRVEAAGTGFLEAALESLAGAGVTSVVVEGGPTLHASLWAAGLVDRVQVFRTPRTLGPAGVPWLDGATFSVDALTDVSRRRLGEDELLEGYVHRTG
jgi:diaminohydroxyphosphoribosylaminopyrimidine deaminase/5-amino-6-(5-phosphoribosylamino)uracil reductase